MRWIKKIFNRDDEFAENEYAPDEQTDAAESGEDGELALDVYQTKDNLVIKSTIAGVKPEDLDITIANDQVSIRGERRQEEEVNAEDYYAQECYWGGFYRSFTLPVEIDVDKATADIKDGILTMILPKASRARAKKVKVRQQAEE